MAYRVKLHNFEGPLDLLLFLIKKNEVDIYDIPIAEITRQYLDYVEIITILDLEGASEFILLAATLIRIKVQMLLPKPLLDEDQEQEDPRQELVQKLLEYKRFKEVAQKLSELEEEQRKLYSRSYFGYDLEIDSEKWKTSSDVTLFSLIKSFKEVLDKAPRITVHRVEDVEVTVDEQMEYILSYLMEYKQVLFTELIARLDGKIIMVVTFIALLELIKRGEIAVRQSVPFGEIWIYKH